MPWTRKQMKAALAVEHGWQPKGEAKGITKSFAAQVIAEGVKGQKPKPKRNKG
jgi:hypothetical protein